MKQLTKAEEGIMQVLWEIKKKLLLNNNKAIFSA